MTSPARKKPRLENAVKATVSDNEDMIGFIEMEVDSSTLDAEGKNSEEVEVVGIPWMANVCKDDNEGSDHLHIYLYSWQNISKLWSVQADLQFILVHKDRTKDAIGTLTREVYQHDTVNSGVAMMKWEDVMNEEKGFISNGKIQIEVHFKVTKTTGFRTQSTFDHGDSTEPTNDIAFLIDGEKVYANKGLLAVHSPVFHAMFYRDFAEKNSKEIPLEDVDEEDFLEMLGLLYPSEDTITDNNVYAVLKLADRFQIKYLLDGAEDHLRRSSDLKTESKLLLSEQYRLVRLQNSCLLKYNDKTSINRLKDLPEYKELSDAIKVQLLEKALEF